MHNRPYAALKRVAPVDQRQMAPDERASNEDRPRAVGERMHPFDEKPAAASSICPVKDVAQAIDLALAGSKAFGTPDVIDQLAVHPACPRREGIVTGMTSAQ